MSPFLSAKTDRASPPHKPTKKSHEKEGYYPPTGLAPALTAFFLAALFNGSWGFFETQ